MGEGPGVVREIINDHRIILITRNAEYKRSPHITVDKIKASAACEEEEKGSRTCRPSWHA
jgi:hypothetical protein